MSASPWIAGLVALFLWWFSTGAILMVVRHVDRVGEHHWAVLTALPVLFLGGVFYLDTLGDTSVAGAYVAFIAALALWGWIELAFLTGVVTGPNRRPMPPGIAEWERFVRAWGTIAYHEMLLVAVLLGIVLFGRGAENVVGLATFATLFVARVSAKLNLYLGVRKINVEFIPSGLRHLPSHFRIARMNWLFPISVTALTGATGYWVSMVMAADAPGAMVGYALVAALTALALLEHWFMVLPLPDERLWRWMLPDGSQTDTPPLEGSATTRGRREGPHAF